MSTGSKSVFKSKNIKSWPWISRQREKNGKRQTEGLGRQIRMDFIRPEAFFGEREYNFQPFPGIFSLLFYRVTPSVNRRAAGMVNRVSPGESVVFTFGVT